MFSGFFQSLFSFNDIKEENEDLRERNAELLSTIVTLQDTLATNQELQHAEILSHEQGFALLAVQTIGLDSAADRIIINRGYNDGVKEQMTLISSQKVLYGRVVKAYGDFSEVMLISSKASTIDVKVQNEDPLQPPIYGAIKGQGNFSLYLDLVPSDAELHAGDVLITSALEGIVPKDLLVGTIIKDTKNDLKPFQTAQVQPLLDVKNIENLFLVTDYPKVR